MGVFNNFFVLQTSMSDSNVEQLSRDDCLRSTRKLSVITFIEETASGACACLYVTVIYIVSCVFGTVL